MFELPEVAWSWFLWEMSVMWWTQFDDNKYGMSLSTMHCARNRKWFQLNQLSQKYFFHEKNIIRKKKLHTSKEKNGVHFNEHHQSRWWTVTSVEWDVKCWLKICATKSWSVHVCVCFNVTRLNFFPLTKKKNWNNKRHETIVNWWAQVSRWFFE